MKRIGPVKSRLERTMGSDPKRGDPKRGRL